MLHRVIRWRISSHLSITTPTSSTTPPSEAALSNCKKVIERDVEVYRKKAQSIGMHDGARSAYVVSHNGHFSAAIKEQQAIHGMFDHRQSNPYVAALALVL